MLNQRMKVSHNINKKGSYFGLGQTVVVGSQCSYQPGMFIVWKPDRTSARSAFGQIANKRRGNIFSDSEKYITK